MPSVLSIAVLLAVLQLTESQRVTCLTACQYADKLRLDCRYENQTNNPLKYEFSLTKDREEVIASTLQLNFFSPLYHKRTTVNISRNLVSLYLSNYSSTDKATYACKLQMDRDYSDKQTGTVKVMREPPLLKCGAVSLIQNMSCLFFLLLLPLIQGASVVSL